VHENFYGILGERSACHPMFGCLVSSTLAIRVQLCRRKNVCLWMELYSAYNLQSKKSDRA